jgi:NADPH-ferrihemoprotein reductase
MPSNISSITTPTNVPVDYIVAIVVLATTIFLCSGWNKRWNRPDPLRYQWFERRQEKVLGRKTQPDNKTKDLSYRLEKEQKDMVILWGSQTGQAEGLAYTLARMLRLRLSVNALVSDLADIIPTTLVSIPSNKPVIFLMSTYGEGDPSDNAVKFCNWLNRSNSTLGNLRYAAFGLGNSTYKHYNRTINTVTRRLDQKGASRIGIIGHGDDAAGTTKDDYLLWEAQITEALMDKFGYEAKSPGYQPSIRVSIVPDDERINIAARGHPLEHRAKPAYSWRTTSTIHPLPVISSQNLTPTTNRRCLHLELDLSSHQELKYRTGDHCLIWPSNPEHEVFGIMRMLGCEHQRSAIVSIQAIETDSTLPFPELCFIEALFKHYLSICAPISRHVLQSLAQVAPNEATKAAILALQMDPSEFKKIHSQNVTMGRLLQTMLKGGATRWDSVPLSWVVENIAPMQPRPYSISSSSVVSPRKLSITAMVVKTPQQNFQYDGDEQVGHGLTTNMLDAIHSNLNSRPLSPEAVLQTNQPWMYDLRGPDDVLDGGKVFCQIRKSKFKLPIAATSSMILVAAGTGIAPFRAFILERARLKAMGRNVGNIMLFYGCRKRDDLLYASELAVAQQQLGIDKFEIVTAFSRENSHPDGSKVYVQDRIRERGLDVARHIVEPGCFFYICGSAAMARDVTAVVIDALGPTTGWDAAKSSILLETAKKAGRWQEDVWG